MSRAAGGSRGGFGALEVVLGGVLLAYFALPLAALLVRGLTPAVLQALTDPVVVRAAGTTLAAATASTALAVLLGVPLAHWLARTERRRLAGAVTGLVAVPLVVPPVVGGLLVLSVVGRPGLGGLTGVDPTGTLAGVVLAQTFVAAPFVVLAARSAFAGVDPALVESAHSQGASRWRAFRRVTLPLARRGVLAGATLAFARAAGEFGATLVLAYHPRTLPVQVWVAFQGRGLDAALPVALVLVVVAIGALAVLRAVGGTLAVSA